MANNLISLSIFQKLKTLLSLEEKKRALSVTILQVIGMIFEMLGIGMIIPIITVVINYNQLVSIPGVSDIIIFLGNPSQESLTIILLLGLIALFLIKSVFSLFLVWKQASFTQDLAKSIAYKLYSRYLSEEYEFHLNSNSSTLVRNVIGEIPVFIKLISALLIIQTEIAIMIGISFVFVLTEPEGAIITFSIILILGVILHRLTKKKLKILAKLRIKSDRNLTKSLYEGLTGIKLLKMMGSEHFFLNTFSINNSISNDIAKRVSFFQRIPRLFFELITVIGIVIFVLISRSNSPDITQLIPKLGVFAFGAFRLMPSFATIISTFQTVSNSLPVLDLIHSQLDTKLNQLSEQNFEFTEGKNIEINNVSFKYLGQENKTLDSINFRILHGEKIGIVGPSGSGKSTLVDILLGLLNVCDGKVLFGEYNIANNPTEWRKHIGYVPQEIFLIDGSIAENIAFGVDKSDIDHDLIMETIRDSNLDEFISTLPNGIYTQVGEGGAKLSGGQRQRIGIARALFRNPSIMIFDEATSALDTITEKQIMSTIDRVGINKTVIIIAHRLSTLKICDRIFEVKKGKVSQTTISDYKQN